MGFKIENMANPDFHYGVSASKNARPFEYLAVHHTSDKPIENLVRYGQTVDQERGGAFGYHYYIGRDGRVIQGAPLDKRTNHIKPPSHSARNREKFTRASNSNALGISLVGAEHGATPEQLESARLLSTQLMREHGISSENVFGHGDIQTDRQHHEGRELVEMLRGEGGQDTLVGQGGAVAQFDPEKYAAFKSQPANNGSDQGQAPAANGFDPEKFKALKAQTAGPKKDEAAAPESAGEGPSRLEAYGRGVVQGATLAHGDEAAGFGDAVARAFAGRMYSPGSEEAADIVAGSKYDQGLVDDIRAANAESKEAYPGTYLAGEVTGGVAAGLAGGGAVSGGSTIAGQGARLIGAGATGGAVYAVGEGNGEADATDIAIGAGAGAGGSLLGIPAGWLIRKVGSFAGRQVAKVFSRKSTFDRATGQLTDEGRRQLQAAGFDPDNITRQLASAFEAEAKTAAGGGGDAARMALAREFDIPLTKGQASGQVPQIASEEAMRAGTRGQSAYDNMAGFDRRQATAVENARGNLADEVAPSGNVDALDAADMAQAGLRREAESARQAGSRAYDAFKEMGGGIKGDAAQMFFGRLARKFDAESIVPEANMTNTASALKMVNRMFEGAQRGAIPFKRIEATRQRLNQLVKAAERGSDGADAYALKTLRAEYDDWLEDSVVNAISDGTPEVMQKVREARKLWGAYAKTFLGKNGADNTIRKIVEDELSPDQVMGWLIGQSKNVGGGQTATVMKKVRNVLGADSEEFLALKRATFDRLTMNLDQMRGTDDMAATLGQFLHGKGKALSQELFTPEELKRLGEFRQALLVLKKPQKATNPSGSGYAAERGLQALWQGVSGALGFAAGGPGGAVGGAMAARTASNFRNAMAAKAATAGITGPAPRLFPEAVGGAIFAQQGPQAALNSLQQPRE